MPTYKTPGVYVEEISKFPPSVAAVETAIPAFIGYTEQNNGSIQVERVKSLVEYEEIFGGPFLQDYSVQLITVDGVDEVDTSNPVTVNTSFLMYYSLQLYFANGGGPCYICSVNSYRDGSNNINQVDSGELTDGLNEIAKYDEPTLLLFPDAKSLTDVSTFYTLYQAAISQCVALQDRFTIIDTYTSTNLSTDIDALRGGIGTNGLRYGAAYYPWLNTILNYAYDENAVQISGGSESYANEPLNEIVDPNNATPPTSVFHTHNEVYHKIRTYLDSQDVTLPPSGIVAGVYARVDSNRGVWKAPANESLSGIADVSVIIDDLDQQDMNVTTSGKSVNAIRKFTGKGTLIWGARTLAGNDNEWRYVPVRRFFNFVEESVKKAVDAFVFEPNDANTWVKVKGLIDNFLILQWRDGALAGAKPEEAFFVKVGLGQTMTSQDILEGRLIVEIGMAAVRPAEFIILRFMHKMQTS